VKGQILDQNSTVNPTGAMLQLRLAKPQKKNCISNTKSSSIPPEKKKGSNDKDSNATINAAKYLEGFVMQEN
jgi:hypothetical protein